LERCIYVFTNNDTSRHDVALDGSIAVAGTSMSMSKSYSRRPSKRSE
jgi:hypothetical protein